MRKKTFLITSLSIAGKHEEEGFDSGFQKGHPLPYKTHQTNITKPEALL